MSINSELHCIEVEINSINDSVERIKTYREELNKYSPFSIGDELEGNDYTHQGKTFIVDETLVSEYGSTGRFGSIQRMPRYFVARGYIKKKDGSLGQHRTVRSVLISEVMQK